MTPCYSSPTGKCQKTAPCQHACDGRVQPTGVLQVEFSRDGVLYINGNSAQHWIDRANARGLAIDRLRAELKAALPIVREYAKQNPQWTGGLDMPTQDPLGAHAWLARNEEA